MQFLNRSEKVILIAFGTTFLPNNETLEKFLNFTTIRSDYNFIVGVAFFHKYRKEIFENIRN